jgi:hypothetical protein
LLELRFASFCPHPGPLTEYRAREKEEYREREEKEYGRGSMR